jgi:hypothetical protein
MRTIRYTSCFKRDYKREKSSRHGKKLDTSLMEIVKLLATDSHYLVATLIIRFPVNGQIIVTATSNQI